MVPTKLKLSVTASDLYAKSQGWPNDGDDRCHWCGSRCTRQVAHDEPTPTPFVKRTTTALFPSSQFICRGCQLWRRERITVNFYEGGLKDVQKPQNWNWFVTEREARVPCIGKPDIYKSLVNPPNRFFLALIEPGNINMIHQAIANDCVDLTNDTQLRFTLNGMGLSYTIYELEHGLRSGPDGRMPGVQALLRMFGPPPSGPPKEKKPGRPPAATKPGMGVESDQSAATA